MSRKSAAAGDRYAKLSVARRAQEGGGEEKKNTGRITDPAFLILMIKI